MSTVTMKQLLEAGVHFGHQTKRWNPKMKPFIFDARNGIYIIDLQKTIRLFREACEFAQSLAEKGEKIIFVGTKKQAQDVIADEAGRAGMHFVNQRWLGGTLTNFATIQQGIMRLKKYEEMKSEGYPGMNKKEVSRRERERQKLVRYLGGVREMERLPGAIFVIDTKKERIAIHEANRLNIPVIGVVDTNSDPDGIDYVIPSNDDAIRAIKLITSRVADALIDGVTLYEKRKAAEAEQEAAAAAASARQAAEEAAAAAGATPEAEAAAGAAGATAAAAAPEAEEVKESGN